MQQESFNDYIQRQHPLSINHVWEFRAKKPDGKTLYRSTLNPSVFKRVQPELPHRSTHASTRSEYSVRGANDAAGNPMWVKSLEETNFLISQANKSKSNA
jgi:hypothetical protein